MTDLYFLALEEFYKHGIILNDDQEYNLCFHVDRNSAQVEGLLEKIARLDFPSVHLLIAKASEKRIPVSYLIHKLRFFGAEQPMNEEGRIIKHNSDEFCLAEMYK